jgi:hypothetical protein
VRVEVVAEQKRAVVVGRSEQARRSVVEEVALVDRLEAERVALLRERGEDRLRLALGRGAQGISPEGALACRLPCDRLPEVLGYNQAPSSFVQ